MKKIALEEHFITPDFITYTRSDFKNFNKQDYEKFIARLSDFENERIQAMDQAGIDISVLSLTDPGVQREPDKALAIKLAHKANDFLAEKISRNPSRFRGFAHLALQDAKAAADELERCVKELHFVGALINGQTNGHYLDEEQYSPFWERVQALNVPIYLHPGSPYEIPHNYKGHEELSGPFWGWGVETATHALRLITSGTFDKFPKNKIILGHMGETLPYLLWRFDSRWKILKSNKPLQKLPSEYIKNNFCITTSGMCANEPLLCAIKALGEENVMFSADYPYESSEVAAQFIEKAPINESTREKICYKNAENLLKLLQHSRR
jgi:2,3-dihydroxybenzoate decarboxylase